MSPIPPFRPTLSTPRLTLRLHSKMSLSQTIQIQTCLNDTVDPVARPDDLIKTPEQCIKQGRNVGLPLSVRGPLNEEGPCNYLVHLNNTANDNETKGALVGMVTLLQPCVDSPVQIGWLTLKDHQGKGYASEAAAEALRYWSEEFGAGEMEIVAVIGEGNGASGRIARKMGMEVGGGEGGRDVWVLPGMRSLGKEDVERLLS